MDQKTENRLQIIEQTLDELALRIEKLEAQRDEESREAEEEED